MALDPNNIYRVVGNERTPRTGPIETASNDRLIVNENKDYYTQLANQFGDSPYSTLFANNPYASYDFTNTYWQNLVSALGFRNNADKYREQMGLAAQQQNYQILHEMFENDYNSPSASASRMRQAGMNPDLLGTSGVAPAASQSEISTPPAVPDTIQIDPVSVGNSIISACLSGVAFAKDIESFKSLKQTVDSQNIKNADSLYGLALQVALNSSDGLPSRYFDTDADSGPWEPDTLDEIRKQMRSSAERFSSSLPKRLRNRFKNTYEDVIKGIPFERERFKSWKETLSNYHESLKGMSSRYYSGHLDDDFKIIADELQQFYDKAERIQAETAPEKAQNELDYQNTKDYNLLAESENLGAQTSKEQLAEELSQGVPEKRAQTERENLDLTKQSQRMQREINKTLANIIHKLSKNADDGSVVAQGIMLFLSVMQLTSLNMSTSKGIGPQGPVSNKSFGFGF